MRSLYGAYRRLGLQRRIMLYVSAGLVLFSALFAVVALETIQQATDLVYRERLTVARMIEHDLDDERVPIQTADSAQLRRMIDVGGNYTVELIDRNGATIATTSSRTPPPVSGHLALVLPLWDLNQAGTRTHNFEINGENHSHVIAFAPLTRVPWGVVVEQEADEAFALPHNLQVRFLWFGVAAVLTGMAGAYITTRRVVRPVNALIHASQEIARGDLAHPLDVSAEGEVGRLARTFDNMRVALKDSREQIARWNQVLEDRVQQRTGELSALVESSHALASTLDLDVLFDILMDQTRAVLSRGEGIALFLYEGDSKLLAVSSSRGFDDAEAAQLHFQVGEAIAGKVFEAQAPVLLKTVAEVRSYQANSSPPNRLHFRRAVSEREVQSALGVPLIAKGARLGALVLYNMSEEAAFADSDVAVLQALADQAAAAIENARLFKEASEVGALRELNRLKTEFVARASHELRTPLTSIKSLSETLLREDLQLDAATQREFLQGIDSASDRLHGIVNDLLMLARIEAGRLQIEHEPVALAQLTAKIIAQFAAQFPRYRFEPVVANDLPPALGDAERIEDVLSNLLSNAVKYSQPGTSVVVRARLQPPNGNGAAQLLTSVSDEGIGIPREEWPHLFERFYRVDNAVTRHVGGAGLGLFICKTYVEAMGGRIWVESANGHGATFSFALPVAEKELAGSDGEPTLSTDPDR